MARTVIVHPGYPKTGTTTLQQSYFPVLCERHGWRYFGKEYDAGGESTTPENVRRFLREFMRYDEIALRQNRESFQTQFLFDQDRTLLISLEELILWSAKYEVLQGEPFVKDLFSTFRKLPALFGDVDTRLKVLLVVRNQTEFIPSLYAQGYSHFFQKISGLGSFEKYLASTGPGGSFPELGSPMYYDEVVSEATMLFGAENLLVLPFESMRTEPLAFQARVSEFLEADCRVETLSRLNTRRFQSGWKSRHYSLFAASRSLRKKTRLGRWLPKGARDTLVSLLRSISLKGPKTIEIAPEGSRCIARRFAASNRRLDTMVTEDLSELGYTMDQDKQNEG